MGWYDFFSRFYDSSLEPLYLDTREAAVEALELQPGLSVLDLPCGTGLSFDGIGAAIGAEGRLVGVDLSSGMLRRAKARAERLGFSFVRLLEADVQTLEAGELEAAVGIARFDRIHVFLGMTAFPDPQAAFDRLWSLLRPGGRFVIVDVHAAKPDFQGRMVNLVARADIRRRAWEPLEAVAEGYAFRELPSKKEHGGQLFVASGTKSVNEGEA